MDGFLLLLGEPLDRMQQMPFWFMACLFMQEETKSPVLITMRSLGCSLVLLISYSQWYCATDFTLIQMTCVLPVSLAWIQIVFVVVNKTVCVVYQWWDINYIYQSGSINEGGKKKSLFQRKSLIASLFVLQEEWENLGCSLSFWKYHSIWILGIARDGAPARVLIKDIKLSRDIWQWGCAASSQSSPE